MSRRCHDCGDGDIDDCDLVRRERAARVWQALQATAVFGVMHEALSWRDDLQEGLWRDMGERGFGAFVRQP